MGRIMLTLGSAAVAERAIKWIREAPKGTRVTFQGPRRSVDQNSRMWLLLTWISDQLDHHGRKYDQEAWKAIFMDAYGKEARFVPSLDGSSVVPIGQKTSDMSVQEMVDFQEFVTAEAMQRGLVIPADERGMI